MRDYEKALKGHPKSTAVTPGNSMAKHAVGIPKQVTGTRKNVIGSRHATGTCGNILEELLNTLRAAFNKLSESSKTHCRDLKTSYEISEKTLREQFAETPTHTMAPPSKNTLQDSILQGQREHLQGFPKHTVGSPRISKHIAMVTPDHE